MKNVFRAAALACAMALPMATTTSAEPPVVIGGALVNVQIVDVIDDITIQDISVGVGVAANIVANVCNVAVNLVSTTLAKGGTYTCEGEIEGAPVEVTAQ